MFSTKVRALIQQQWAGLLALFLVLAGGTAYATHPGGANTISSGDIIDQQVRTQDIRDEAVTAPKLGPSSVTSGKLANGQVQAEDLAPGASGARAWGLVSAGGTLLQQKNITEVTRPTDGVYCIDPGSGINADTAVMVVGEEFQSGITGAGFDDVSHVEWNSLSSCPFGTMEVLTFAGFGDQATGGETDFGGFDVEPHNLGFTFVIP